MSKLTPVLALTLLFAISTLEAAPGETSGSPLAPLLVTGLDRATGAMQLTFQSGCGTTGNAIRYGSLDQVGTLAWSGSVCGAGTSGSYSNFNPGSGSYFFVVVGNDAPEEGSYGRSRFGAATIERPPAAGTCGLTQNLADACTPVSAGSACTTSADCGQRTTCVLGATGGGQCACLPPFGGSYCETCAPGYAGPDCRECAAGYLSNKMQNESGGDLPDDPTAPSVFRCVPDVPGDCGGRTCSGHGTCAVSGRDAICGCLPGYAGDECEQCAPNYEVDASGACTLGGACREAKCGGHGSCIPAPFGEVACQCDAGYSGTDCGGPALSIVPSSDTLTLYEGQSIVLRPQGGVGPYSFTLLAGPARIEPCDPRGTDPLCPSDAVRLTAEGLDPHDDGVVVLYPQVTDGAGHQTAINLAAIPSSVLPFTGPIRTELVPFYNAMLKYMRARGIRGGVLGIAKGGSIIATNGYGYRDAGLDSDPFVNAGEPGPLVQPHSPFRIASVTKTMTAAAVRDAAADAGVTVSSPAPFDRAASWVQQSTGINLVNGFSQFDYNLLTPNLTDQRWGNVTIQHLLNHHVGFWRDSNLASTNGLGNYGLSPLPFTVDQANLNGLQSALTGFSNDITYATSHVFAGMQLTSDPRPTVRRMIQFAAGNTFQYPPGGNVGNGDNYANIGYMIAGRVLEGLKGEDYDPDDPSAPEGWGQYPTLLRRYVCEASGVQSGIWPGDAFQPQAFEPYYRDIDAGGNEIWGWDVARAADTIRFNNVSQKWEFCQGSCPNGQGAQWGQSANAPNAYGGVWLAQRNSAGGLVATTSALLKFARNHRVKVGQPLDQAATGIGSLLQTPGSYGSGGSHNGSLPGVSSLLWQMGGIRTNNVPTGTGAWNDDPSAPVDIDDNGNVVINETLVGASTCSLPSDVAVAVMFNQREDQRAPGGLNNTNAQATGNSTNPTVYGRIVDFLGDAACKVKAQGWPNLAEPPAQVLLPPICP